MKIERTKNATRNMVAGFGLKIYTIIVPFIMRTIMLYLMGSQYLGLDGLFASVLQVLNLTELGVGMAMVNSMYKPIAEDDSDKICALMRLYKLYYRCIGIVILAIGLLLLPIIPSLAGTELPNGLNIYILYLVNLGATVLSYWLFAYKNSLLVAHQRNDIQSVITIIINTIKYFLQIGVLFLFRNYYLYLIVNVLTQILQNVVCAYMAGKIYPNYHAKGNLAKKEIDALNKKIKDVFTAKIGAVVVNSADTLVISAFLGLQMLAIYQNYYYIVTSIIGMILIIFNSCTAGIGNSIVVETKEKNYQDLKKLTFIIAWLAGLGACCLLCLFQPFMEIWAGKELMLNINAVICFAIYFFIYEINALLNTYKDAAGIWHEDRFRPLVTAMGNLLLNIILVQIIGIYGVLLSTVVTTLCIGMPWLLHNLFTILFEKNELKDYVRQLLAYSVSTFIVSLVTFAICSLIEGKLWIVLLGRTIVCLFLTNILYFVLYHKKIEFIQSVMMLENITNGKFKLNKILKS